jgi:hypothetical protein
LILNFIILVDFTIQTSIFYFLLQPSVGQRTTILRLDVKKSSVLLTGCWGI